MLGIGIGFGIVALISFFIGTIAASNNSKDSKMDLSSLSKDKPLYSLRKGMINLLSVSGKKDVETIYHHFDLLCTCIEDENERLNFNKDEFQKILEEFIRPLIKNLSAICLRLNRAHSSITQTKKNLQKLRTLETQKKKLLDSLVSRENAEQSKELERDRKLYIEELRGWLFSIQSQIRAEEKKLEKCEKTYMDLYTALDEIICLLHHDFLNCSNVQEICILGKNIPSNDARSKIQQELDILLDKARMEDEFLRWYEESLDIKEKQNS